MENLCHRHFTRAFKVNKYETKIKFSQDLDAFVVNHFKEDKGPEKIKSISGWKDHSTHLRPICA